MRIKKVTFKNFRSCFDLTVHLSDVNILVGPNNSGKSTIINAFRLLRVAIQKARSSQLELLTIDEGAQVWGYRFTDRQISVSLDSISTDYSEDTCQVQFQLDSGESLTLLFPEQNVCVFYYSRDRFLKLTPAQFRSRFPVNIKVVPVLGPLRKEEEVLDPKTVRSGLDLHVSSLHFRNYWLLNKDTFPEFANAIEQTWPGMSVERPQVIDGVVRMFCSENRIPREIYNSGFGFQIWCQLLTHLGRSSDSSIIVIDEPEIYLHPDVQRQLIHILKDMGPDFLLATHSVEIISESEPKDIISLNKKSQTARRLNNVAGVQDTIKGIGSTTNITLTHLARTKKMVFVEGLDDYRLIQRFSRTANLPDVGRGFDLTPIESNGFKSWERIKEFAGLLTKAISEDFSIFAIYDRDFYPEELLIEIKNKLNNEGVGVHFHRRKEIENYLLEPSYLAKAIGRQLKEKGKLESHYSVGEISKILIEISDDFEEDVQAQLIAKRNEYFEHSPRDSSEVTKETIKYFKEKWFTLEGRLELLPGKKVLAKFREKMQSEGLSLTNFKLTDACGPDEIPPDLLALLKTLENFRAGRATY